MFKDANLPETEAWAAMTQDLRESKAARNNLQRENVLVFCMSTPFVAEVLVRSLKRKLEEVERQKEE